MQKAKRNAAYLEKLDKSHEQRSRKNKFPFHGRIKKIEAYGRNHGIYGENVK